MTDTLLIVGPGGIGKSPLDAALRADIGRVDPYRLRHSGPRDQNDIYYAHPKLRDELLASYERLRLRPTRLSDGIDWFAEARALFLRVRDEFQLLLLDGFRSPIAKAEIFAPAIPVILENADLKRFFGRTTMLILNPVGPLATLANLDAIKEKTRSNCEKRGDSPESITQRVGSIDEEVDAWRRMIALGACECHDWPFAEYIYRDQDRTKTLIGARRLVVERCPGTEVFFKTEDEIRAAAETQALGQTTVTK